MNPYIAQLHSYLAQNPPNYGFPDIRSLSELLWSTYTQYNPIDNYVIREKIYALKPVMDALTPKLKHLLFDTILELCEANERAAFLEGLRAGAQLTDELFGEKAAE